MNKKSFIVSSVSAFALLVSAVAVHAYTPSPALSSLLATYREEARKADPSFRDFSADRGKEVYFKKQINAEGKEVSCVTCHTENLSAMGRTTAGKMIDPLSPAKNPKRLTTIAEMQKWLKRNFKQVYGREGTAKEKGDVLYYIMNQ